LPAAGYLQSQITGQHYINYTESKSIKTAKKTQKNSQFQLGMGAVKQLAEKRLDNRLVN